GLPAVGGLVDVDGVVLVVGPRHVDLAVRADLGVGADHGGALVVHLGGVPGLALVAGGRQAVLLGAVVVVVVPGDVDVPGVGAVRHVRRHEVLVGVDVGDGGHPAPLGGALRLHQVHQRGLLTLGVDAQERVVGVALLVEGHGGVGAEAIHRRGRQRQLGVLPGLTAVEGLIDAHRAVGADAVGAADQVVRIGRVDGDVRLRLRAGLVGDVDVGADGGRALGQRV